MSFINIIFLGYRLKYVSASVGFFAAGFWITILVLSAIYKGNLIAFLTVQKFESPINSLSELAMASNYEIGLVKGQALVQVLQVSLNENLNLLYFKI